MPGRWSSPAPSGSSLMPTMGAERWLRGKACGPWASGLSHGPHGCQLGISGLALTVPPHPLAQNRGRPHLASGQTQLAHGCIYTAASEPWVDMLRPVGLKVPIAMQAGPGCVGTPGSAPHLQCGHRLALSWGGAVLSPHVQNLDTGSPDASRQAREGGSITCHPAPSSTPTAALSSLAPGPPRIGSQQGALLDAGMFRH